MIKRSWIRLSMVVVLISGLLFLTGCTDEEVSQFLETLVIFFEEIEEQEIYTEAPTPQQDFVLQDVGYINVHFTNPTNPTVVSVDKHLVHLIDTAQTTVYGAVFELDLDSVTESLISAHRRGVTVHIVYDSEHTKDDPQIEYLINTGIKAVPDNRSALMHNKFFIIDSTTVWTGSWNVTNNGTYKNNNNVVVIASTKLAETYTAEFNEMLDGQFGTQSPETILHSVVYVGDATVRPYFAPEGDTLTPLLVEISDAEKYIHFMTFSFTQDELGKALVERHTAGVDIEGIFERRGASTEYSECSLLLETGIPVYGDGNPRTMHHKVVIIDGKTVISGSYNFSASAEEDNDENFLIIKDPLVAQKFEEEYAAMFAQATRFKDTCRIEE